jgi:hypothetical protein
VTFLTKRRLVVGILTLAVAILVGVVFGYLAGLAVVLALVTIVLLTRSMGAELEIEGRTTRHWGRRVMGSDTDEPPKR